MNFIDQALKYHKFHLCMEKLEILLINCRTIMSFIDLSQEKNSEFWKFIVVKNCRFHQSFENCEISLIGHGKLHYFIDQGQKKSQILLFERGKFASFVHWGQKHCEFQ